METILEFIRERDYLKENALLIKQKEGKQGLSKRLTALVDFKREQKEKLKELLSRFPYSFKELCERYFIIQDKGGKLIPFIFNEWQNKTFEWMIDIYNKTGEIDGVIIKGRQGGMTTESVALLVFQMLALKANVSAISHNFVNISNVYLIADRAINNFFFKLDIRNKNQGHKIGINNNLFRFYTSGEQGASNTTIEGTTILGLLNDEAGLRTKPVDLQALAKLKNKIHLTIGTPRGTGNLLYMTYLAYKEGGQSYKILFLPWFELKEYEIETEIGFISSQQVQEYIKKNNLEWLPLRKQKWLEVTLMDFKKSSFNPISAFNYEYPATIEMGFSDSAENCFVNPFFINQAFAKQNIKSTNIIIGIDVAGGGDKCIVCLRYGKVAEFIELVHNANEYGFGFQSKVVQLINFIKDELSEYNIEMLNYDISGIGKEFGDVLQKMLRNYTFWNLPINPVHFGSKVEYMVGWETLKRGIKEDMYFNLREALSKEKLTFNPKYQRLREELLNTKIIMRNGEEFLEKKDDLKKHLGGSPDYADALALTFANTMNKKISIEMKNSYHKS